MDRDDPRRTDCRVVGVGLPGKFANQPERLLLRLVGRFLSMHRSKLAHQRAKHQVQA